MTGNRAWGLSVEAETPEGGRTVPRWIALLLGLAVIVGACGSSEESGVPDLAAQTEVDTSTMVPAGETGDATVPTTAVAPATEPDDPPSTGSIAVAPPDEQEVPMSQDPAEPTVPPEPEPAAIDPSLAGLITQAVADLAARRSLAESDIVVLKAELVVWPNAALATARSVIDTPL